MLQLDVVVVVFIVLSGLDDFKSLLVNVTCIHTPAVKKKKKKTKTFDTTSIPLSRQIRVVLSRQTRVVLSRRTRVVLSRQK